MREKILKVIFMFKKIYILNRILLILYISIYNVKKV